MTRSLLTVLIVVLSGCAATEIGRHQSYTPSRNSEVTTQSNEGLAPLSPQPLAQASTQSSLSAYPRNINQTGASSAVQALYAQAELDRHSGRLDAASNALGRAIQLDPRNAFVWSALAKIDMLMQQYDQAENEASKSNSLAGGNPWLESKNWRIIAAARQASGNARGALEAQSRAEEIMQGFTAGQ